MGWSSGSPGCEKRARGDLTQTGLDLIVVGRRHRCVQGCGRTDGGQALRQVTVVHLGMSLDHRLQQGRGRSTSRARHGPVMPRLGQRFAAAAHGRITERSSCGAPPGRGCREPRTWSPSRGSSLDPPVASRPGTGKAYFRGKKRLLNPRPPHFPAQDIRRFITRSRGAVPLTPRGSEGRADSWARRCWLPRIGVSCDNMGERKCIQSVFSYKFIYENNTYIILYKIY